MSLIDQVKKAANEKYQYAQSAHLDNEDMRDIYVIGAETALSLCTEALDEAKRKLKVAEDAIVDAQNQFYRIETADWCAEQMRLGARSGWHGLKRALIELGVHPCLEPEGT